MTTSSRVSFHRSQMNSVSLSSYVGIHSVITAVWVSNMDYTVSCRMIGAKILLHFAKILDHAVLIDTLWLPHIRVLYPGAPVPRSFTSTEYSFRNHVTLPGFLFRPKLS